MPKSSPARPLHTLDSTAESAWMGPRLGLWVASILLLAASGSSGHRLTEPGSGHAILGPQSFGAPGSSVRMPPASKSIASESPTQPLVETDFRSPSDPDRPSPGVPDRIRVGLETDLGQVEVGCCGRELMLVAGERKISFAGRAVVQPVAQSEALAVYRLQVAALRDESLALAMVERLRLHAPGPWDLVIDAGRNLFKVRGGAASTREEAEQLRSALEGLGLEEPWVVREESELAAPGFFVETAAGRLEMAGRWLAVESPERVVSHDDTRYRGRLLIYLNDRGQLNLINELGFEDYLRGVVPRELGPELYPEIEAIKAQAIAARTYTVRNLGGFEDEGFDICATPGCQVYGGLGGEHPLSDRAIRETRGMLLVHADVAIEALYSASCGGHTENVEVVFPGRTAPYLRGVPCLEAGAHRLDGMPGVRPLPSVIVERLLGGTLADRGRGMSPRSRLSSQLLELASRAGLAPAAATELRSLAPDEVRRYLASIFDLALDARLLATSDLGSLALAPAEAGLSAVDGALAQELHAVLAGSDGQLKRSGSDRVVRAMATRLGLIIEREAQFVELGNGRLTVREGPVQRHLELGQLATYRETRKGEVPGPLRLMAGDPLTLELDRDGELLALLQGPVLEMALDPRVERSPWSRYRSRARLAAEIERRYPGFAFDRFEVLERGVSGRVGRLRLIAEDGEFNDVEGLAVRWILDLPDNLFESQSTESGWRFEGRGWGHGVGMCQLGAFGMASRGLHHAVILSHYYSGVEIVRASVEIRQLAGPRPQEALVSGATGKL